MGELPTTDEVAEMIKAKVGNGKGVPNGVASLDGNMKIPTSQLPSFVDDVLEFAGFLSTKPTISTTSTTLSGEVYYCSPTKKFIIKVGTTYYANWGGASSWGELADQDPINGYPPQKGKIYVDTTTNKCYRWSGSALVELPKSLVIGTTAGTAYGWRGRALRCARRSRNSTHSKTPKMPSTASARSTPIKNTRRQPEHIRDHRCGS